jgi:phage terminase large subunit
MELEILHTNVFERNLDAYNLKGSKFLINIGGTRSSKTYSIIQLLIFLGLQFKRKDIVVVRESRSNLKKTVVDDLINILNELNIYDDVNFNKTDLIYKFKQTGSRIKFISTDEPAKLRGLSSDILYFNEITSIEYEAFLQLNMRCKGKIFIDFNPSDPNHYIFDLINQRPNDCVVIKSTYLDNPFLPETQIKEIENLINVDQNYYKIYVLGEVPTKASNVYSHFKFITQPTKGELLTMGLDFGYQHATALVAIYKSINDDGYFIEELIYKSHLTNSDLISLMNSMNISKTTTIYADHSRPESITEIKRAGYKIEPADKDVKQGIDTVKSSIIYVDSNSINIQREYKLYSYKTTGNKILEDVIKEHDDALDALRYGLYTYKKKGKITGKIKVFTI